MIARRPGRASATIPAVRRAAAILVCLGCAVLALAQTQPASQTPSATTKPADLAASVARLGDRDPLVRDAARESLMSLDAADLPQLRDAVAGTLPNTTIRSALRDAVTHVYLTGKHHFAGATGGVIGIRRILTDDEPPTIFFRTIGYDGYRVLRDGDVIVAARRPGAAAFERVETFAALRSQLERLSAGQWVDLRVVRGDRTVEVRLRLGPNDPRLETLGGNNPYSDDAKRYWSEQFAPALGAPPDSGT